MFDKIKKVLFIGIILGTALLSHAKMPITTPDARQGNFFDQVNLDWTHAPYWFDGKAEINIYQSSVVKYGVPRQTDKVVHIIVSEKHKKDLLVKADNWREPGLIDVLKFNYLTTVQTGIYTYREMMSIFFDRANGHSAKMTFSSQEWCGQSFKEILNFDGRSSFCFDTYWDGQGKGEFEVDFPRDLVLYDALPVQLRMLNFRKNLSAEMSLLPTQISSKVQKPVVERAFLKVRIPIQIQVPAGTFKVYPVTVEHRRGTDRFWFETKFPHRLIKWESYAGNQYQLLKSEKLAYWQLNKPGDERYLP